MRLTVKTITCLAIVLSSVLYVAVVSFAEPPKETTSKVSQKEKPASTKKKKRKKIDERRVTVKVARERAKLSHNIYIAALDVMHHHYFRKDRTSVPARVMEDMFDEISRKENIKAKWITVNAKVMSIDHKPEGDFEKQAAKSIAAGKNEYERVEKGLYRRAVGISLMNRGCLGCHMGFGADDKRDRFAGLVITIPVKSEREGEAPAEPRSRNKPSSNK